MKKGLVVFWLLFLIPGVLATITLEGPTNSVYNFGDKLDVNGKIIESKDYYGLFKIDLECDGNKQSMLIRSMSVRGNQEYPIKEELSVTPEITGSCTLKAYLMVNNNEIDSTRSTPFKVTKDLLGGFKGGETKLQAGKTIAFEGDITRMGGDKINGIAHIYFKKTGEVVFSDNKDVRRGHFSYEKDTSNMDAGDYNIDMNVEDDKGNEFLFNNALSFSLLNEIAVTAETDRVHVMPGKRLRIRGKAITILGENVGKGKAEITFDDEKFTTDVIWGGFSYDLKLDKNIKSGEHKVDLVVEDNKGNRGSSQLSVIIDPVLTGLNVILDKEGYMPKDMIILNPSLVDQAGDLLDKEVNIEMANSKGKTVFSNKFRTNQDVKLQLAEFSIPGEWEIRAKVDKLKTEKAFNVSVVNLLQMKIVNQSLFIKNIGNIPVRQLLDVQLKGQNVESNIKEDLSLDLNESTLIDLSYGTITGTYDVFVQDQEFKDVYIEGVEKISFDWLWYVLIGVITLGILYVILNWRRWQVKAIKDRLDRKKAGELRKKILAGKSLSSTEDRALKQYHMRMNEEVDKRRKSPFGFFSGFKKKEKDEYVSRPVKKEPEYKPLDVYQTIGRKETSWEKRARERRERFERRKGKEGSGEEGLFKMFG